MSNIIALDGNNFGGTTDSDIIVNIEAAIGAGADVIHGGEGDDVILGDHHDLFVDGSSGNGLPGAEMSLDNAAAWSRDENEDVADSTITPWTSVIGTGANAFDLFRVTIGAGQTITLDIDYAIGAFGGPSWNGEIKLFDPGGIQIAGNDDASALDPGSTYAPGSADLRDPGLTFTVGAAGTYYIRVEQFDDTSIDAGNPYLLNVSVTGHAVGPAGVTDQDTLFGDAGNDVLKGGGGDDLLFGGFGSDSVYGGAGADVITGDADGADDSFYGGSGNDQYVLYETGGTTTILDASGTDELILSASASFWSVDLAAGTGSAAGAMLNFGPNTIESITGSANGDTLLGSNGNNVIVGNGGGDIVEGRGGNDVLTAGGGIGDTVSYEHAGGNVIVSLAKTAAQATGAAGTDTISGFENLIGSIFNDTLTGDAGDNLFLGLDGNDVIDGGAGNDTLYGGGGNDTASYASATAAVTVILGVLDPQDTVGAGTDSLNNIENLSGSAFNDVLTGSIGANRLSGMNGNDTLEGGFGANVLDGGAGTDIASYAHATAAVTVNLAIGGSQNTGGAGSDQLVAIEGLTGSIYNDVLTGNDADNVISGGDGDDVIKGGLGRDTLAGGIGIDTVSYAFNLAPVIVNLAIVTAQETVGAGIDTLSGFEKVIGTVYDDRLIGDGGANILSGGSGNDIVTGGLGNDTLDGGVGNDTVSYAGAANANAGITASLVVAGAQATGGAGSDTLVAIENLTGSSFADTLTGSSAANVLIGGNGNDVLIGSGGADTLTGGANNDIFKYLALADSSNAASDRITDLVATDRLDVSAIDANTALAGNQAFAFAAGGFTHVAAQYTLAYDGGTNTTTARFDVNGDAAADMTILFTGDVTALTGNWIL